jgi:sarcosine oxidase subunit alpha
LHTEKANAEDRKMLVGLQVPDGEPPLVTGSHVASDGVHPRSLGYVTSSYDRPTLGHPIALGIVERGGQRIGDGVTIWHSEFTRTATICAPCFYDQEGERLNA